MTDLELVMLPARLCAAGVIACAQALTVPTPENPQNWCSGAACRNWTWEHNRTRTPGDVLVYRLRWWLDGNANIGEALLSSRDVELTCGTSRCTHYTVFRIPPSTTFPHRLEVCAASPGGEVDEELCATHEWRNQ